jgi:quercetin dioxygenase-like cupin family protein
MQVTRIATAQPYTAPEHFDMTCLRLQGREATTTRSMWMGLSRLMPGGHTSLRASAQEKLYVVISGQVTLGNGAQEQVLGPLDSCVFAPGEPRALRNDSDQPAQILLIMQELPG